MASRGSLEKISNTPAKVPVVLSCHPLCRGKVAAYDLDRPGDGVPEHKAHDPASKNRCVDMFDNSVALVVRFLDHTVIIDFYVALDKGQSLVGGRQAIIALYSAAGGEKIKVVYFILGKTFVHPEIDIVKSLFKFGNDKVVFDKVVMLVNGAKSKVGAPYVDKATVEGKIVKHDKDKKVIVFKQRAKKGYRKKQGHRQFFTRVMVTKIRTTAARTKAAAAEVEAPAEEN